MPIFLSSETIVSCAKRTSTRLSGPTPFVGSEPRKKLRQIDISGTVARSWNTDWRFLFLGVILLVAVLVNNYIRKRAEGARR